MNPYRRIYSMAERPGSIERFGAGLKVGRWDKTFILWYVWRGR